jgi:uncharacterized membrane protein YkvA (DUF1232 family)
MERHEWITRELMSLSWYGHYLLEAILDPDLNPAGRSQAVAAGKYLVEWEDLIPDTDPVFGYVDDLFVVLLGLEQLMKLGGREAIAKYGPKKLPGEISLEQKIKEAKENFQGFWAYVAKEVGGQFQEIQRTLRKDESVIEKLKTMLQNYVQAASQRPVQPVDRASLEEFLKTKGKAKAGSPARAQRG